MCKNCDTCGGTMTEKECQKYFKQHHIFPCIVMTGIVVIMVGIVAGSLTILLIKWLINLI
jgi:hypothetical protein